MGEELKLEATVVDQFSKPLRDLRDKLKEIRSPEGVKEIKEKFEGLHKSIERTTDLLKEGGKAALEGFGISAIGAAGAIAGIGEAVREFVGSASGFAAFQRQTNISADTLRQLQYVAKNFSINPTAIAGDLKTFASNLYDVQRNVGSVYTTLLGMGPGGASLAKALHDASSPDQAVRIFAEYLSEITEKAKTDPSLIETRNRLSSLMTGSLDFSDLASKGLPALREFWEQAKRSIPQLSKEDKSRADAFNKAVNELGTSLSNLKEKVGADLAPTFTTLVEQMTKFVDLHKSDISHGIEAAAEALADAIKNVDWKEVGHDIEQVAESLMAAARGILAVRNFVKDPLGIKPQLNAQSNQEIEDAKAKIVKNEEILKNTNIDPIYAAAVKGEIAELRKRIENLTDILKKSNAAAEKQNDLIQKESFNPDGQQGGGFGGLIQRVSYGSVGGAAAHAAHSEVARRLNGGVSSPGTSGPLDTAVGKGTNKDIVDYIRRSAMRNHIDPDVAIAVANSEGLRGYDPSKPDKGGDQGTSFTPFQLHYKNNIPGLSNPGMGDDFTRETGLDARDPKNVRAAIDYALRRASREGWGAWHGAARVGIGRRQGIGAYNGPAPSEPRASSGIASNHAWPSSWHRGDLLRSAQGAGVFGIGGPQTGGRGSLDITVTGPKGTSVKPSMGNLFRETTVTRGRSMVLAGEDV